MNTKAYHDHISRFSFVVWGEGANKRVPLDVKVSAEKCNRIKDRLLTFCFILCSIVPVIVAIYFILKLHTALKHDEGDWFHWTNACEDG